MQPTTTSPTISPTAVGPGAITDQGIAPDPLLQGATDYEYVTLYNPLETQFVGVFGTSRPVNIPFQIRGDSMGQTVTKTEQDVARNYGLPLKNKDHQAEGHFQQQVQIPAKGTTVLLGSEAQVICRQLVNEIMQQRGQKLLLADAHARNAVELEVVKSRGSVNDRLGRGPMSVRDQLQDAVDDMNTQEPTDEPEFPSLTAQPATLPIIQPKRGGRPVGSKNRTTAPAG